MTQVIIPGTETYPQPEAEILSFISNGELPEGISISDELDSAMAEHGGTLQYWKPGAQVGTRSGFDKVYFQRKFDAAVRILKNRGVEVDDQDIADTQAFVDEAFGVYTGERQPYRQSGSSAFVAATRIKRRAADEFSPVDYRKETFGCLPILKYMDEASAQKVMVGLPPFVLDYYGNKRDRGGVMIFSPLFLNLVEDAGDKFAEVGVAVAQETTWFAEEVMDVKVMSLAALLPAATFYGKLFTRNDAPDSRIHITTGHAGTTWGIGQVVTRMLNEGRIVSAYENKIGVLGAGGIGGAAAPMFLETMPDAQLMMHDVKEGKQAAVVRKLREEFGENRVLAAASVRDVLEFAGVTLSAINDRIDLTKLGLPEGALLGKGYADDSQPAAISAEQVEALGGTHVGVIGQDGRKRPNRRHRFNYGGVGPLRDNEMYFCDVEGRAIAESGRFDLAIQRAAKADDVRKIGEVAAQLGYKAAPLQTLRNGKAVEV